MKKKTVIIAVLVFALLVIAYIVASFCSIRTVDADSLQVLSRKTEDGVLSMDIGIVALEVAVEKANPMTGRNFFTNRIGFSLVNRYSRIW